MQLEKLFASGMRNWRVVTWDKERNFAEHSSLAPLVLVAHIRGKVIGGSLQTKISKLRPLPPRNRVNESGLYPMSRCQTCRY